MVGKAHERGISGMQRLPHMLQVYSLGVESSSSKDTHISDTHIRTTPQAIPDSSPVPQVTQQKVDKVPKRKHSLTHSLTD